MVRSCALQDGIDLRCERVVPNSLGGEMLRRVHAVHLGINSCLRHAKDVIFWPNMSSEIRNYVKTTRNMQFLGQATIHKT